MGSSNDDMLILDWICESHLLFFREYSIGILQIKNNLHGFKLAYRYQFNSSHWVIQSIRGVRVHVAIFDAPNDNMKLIWGTLLK